MGYESRLYIVAKTDAQCTFNNALYYAEVLAEINLCVTSMRFRDGIKKYGKDTDCGLFIDDEQTNEDKYGDIMQELSLEDAIKVIENCMSEPYRRWIPCVSMLNGFRLSEAQGEWGDCLRVLHYGY